MNNTYTRPRMGHAGLVTVAGHDSDDVPKAILRSILLQAGLTMEEFQEFE